MKVTSFASAAFGVVLSFAQVVCALAGEIPVSPFGSAAGSAQAAANSVAGQTTPNAQFQFPTPFTSLKVPSVAISKAKRAQYEHRPGTGKVLVHQWSSVDKSLPSELQPNSGYLQPRDNTTASMTLKEAIYLAIHDNPGMKAEILEPLAAEESVRQANAAFDPLMSAEVAITKNVVPTITNFSTVGSAAFERKEYDWNFGITKLSSLTNGSLAISFDNNRFQSNARTWTVDPSYNPSIAIS